MGRKGEFKEKPKKGPGRKARKQKEPTLPKHLQGMLIDLLILYWYSSCSCYYYYFMGIFQFYRALGIVKRN